MNIFRLFQRWVEKARDNTTRGSDVPSSAPLTLTAASEETVYERNETAEDVPYQAEVDLVGRASVVWSDAIRWIAPGSTAVVAGRSVGGMVYLGPGQGRVIWEQTSRPVIDPSLPVAEVDNEFSGESMPYWPSYSGISPQARATYLDWLAGGRSDKRYGVGYVFLYFYGLERRFFVDSPDDDEKRLLIAEVERLLHTYGENRSVRSYLGAFLDAAQAILGSTGETKPNFERSGYELPLSLRITIGRMSRESRPLSADWLLSWYVTHQDYPLRTPATRAFPEFRALFTQLFDERFPEGLKVPVPKRTLRAYYRSASSEFDSNLDEHIGHLPDISRITRPLNVAKPIVDEATEALDRYSRFLGRNPDGRGTIEAHALLPERLWPSFPCAEVDDLRQWAEEIIDAGGLVPVVQVIERLEGAPPERITKRRLTDAADALARLSVGMAPDPRFALRSPKYGEPVVLFRMPEGVTSLDEVSGRYKSILVAIAIGSFIAQADEAVAATEHGELVAMIDPAVDLSKTELARLRANLNWMEAVPPDLALFRRHLKDVPDDASHQLGQFALALAASDGVVSTKEVGALERLYKAMGLEQGGIYSALHALTSGDEPATVLPAGRQEQGFGIPTRPDAGGSVNLDAERVASVMANTARVSSILGEIFQEDEPEDEPVEILEDDNNGFTGLDAKHAAFLGELLVRPHWEEGEYETLARQFQLMPAGAIETLNEWSLDHFDDLLIEEGQGYTVNQEIKAEITVGVG